MFNWIAKNLIPQNTHNQLSLVCIDVTKYSHTFTVPLPQIEAGYNSNIIVPLNIVSEYQKKKYKRVIFRVNNSIEKHGALNSLGDGRYFIFLNKQERLRLHRSGAIELVIEIGPDHSKYGMSMPTELKEVLHLYPEAERYFRKLTPGRQRSIIHLVSKPKGEQTRIRKAIMIMNYLIDFRGNVDLQEMQQYMKNYREKF